MEWQLGLVFLMVALATAYLGRRAWRTWSGTKKGGCGGGCGCAGKVGPTAGNSAKDLIPVEQLMLRRPSP